MDLYPLKEKHPNIIKSKSGKGLDEITLEAIVAGDVTAEDIKISKEVLVLQAEVARQEGKIQLAQNFVRSAELIEIPDDEILDMYNMLRPYRSTEEELKALSSRLRTEYDAQVCADFIEETLYVYKKRDLLKQ
ncbi:diol dehydratase small subunit [Vallitaleaceae bacterium 9-2]